MSLENDIRQLGRVPIFAELNHEARRLLAFSAETRILRAGDILFQRGDASDGGYFVRSGTIALDFAKGFERSIELVGQSSLIGETALIAQTERPATAIAREPASVLKISRELFCRVLNEYPECAEQIRRSFSARLSSFVSELGRLRESSKPQINADHSAMRLD